MFVLYLFAHDMNDVILVHPTLNHVSLSLDVNECEEIDNTAGMLHGHMS